MPNFQFQLPLQKGTEVYPYVTAPLPVVRVNLIPPPENSKMPQRNWEALANQILDEQRGNITNFCMAQRQQLSLQIGSHRTVHREFPGVDVEYRNAQGQEYVTLTVKPVIPEKKEDDDYLMVLYNSNQIAALSLASMSSTPEIVYKATLNFSSWGTDRMQMSQIKVDKDDGSMILAPISVTDDNSIVAQDTHHVCMLKGGFSNFVRSTTPSDYTAMLNGRARKYYIPGDWFEIVELDNSKVELRYGGIAGGQVVPGADGFVHPFAIAGDGTYYFCPESYAYLFSMIQSLNPQEQSINPFRTKEWVEDYIQGLIDSNSGATILNFGNPGAVGYDDWLNNYFLPLYWQTSSGMTDGKDRINGWSSYGVLLPSREYQFVYNPAITLFYAYIVDEVQRDDDLSAVYPLMTYSVNAEDKLDVLEVTMAPVNAHLSYVETFIQTGSNPVVGYSPLTYSAMHKSYGIDTSSWLYNGVFAGTADFSKQQDGLRWKGDYIRPFLISYPPSFSVDDGDFYLLKTYGQDQFLYTPMGRQEITSFWGNDSNAATGGNPFIARNMFKPWMHISNGKHNLQAFVVEDKPFIVFDREDVGDALAEVLETDIGNIQGALMGISLSRMKELV